mmetsp:Transcript_13008/g.33564  ORF Transcript_13008/g.33564 Transcript_13008/m.33564 type:complete len:220 (-) Transcript_13008:278-937(-)
MTAASLAVGPAFDTSSLISRCALSSLRTRSRSSGSTSAAGAPAGAPYSAPSTPLPGGGVDAASAGAAWASAGTSMPSSTSTAARATSSSRAFASASPRYEEFAPSSVSRKACVLVSTFTKRVTPSCSVSGASTRIARDACAPERNSHSPKAFILPVMGSDGRFQLMIMPHASSTRLSVASSTESGILPTYSVHGRSAGPIGGGPCPGGGNCIGGSGIST